MNIRTISREQTLPSMVKINTDVKSLGDSMGIILVPVTGNQYERKGQSHGENKTGQDNQGKEKTEMV